MPRSLAVHPVFVSTRSTPCGSINGSTSAQLHLRGRSVEVELFFVVFNLKAPKRFVHKEYLNMTRRFLMSAVVALVASLGLTASATFADAVKADACCCGDTCNCEECGCCKSCDDGKCTDCSDCTCEGCGCCDKS
jgi:hypothetical protein